MVEGDLFGPEPELSARGVDFDAPSRAVKVVLHLSAGGALSLLDLVSLVQTGDPPPTSVPPANAPVTSTPASAVVTPAVSPSFTG